MYILPKIGQQYIHFRKKKHYEVVVIYKGLYNDAKLGNEPLFARPVEEFIGKVPDDETGEEVDRFAIVV